MKCKFSKSRKRDEGAIRLDGQEILNGEFSILWINNT